MINAWASFVPTINALTMFYQGSGNCLIEVESSFLKRPGGVLLIEHTKTGGTSWHPFEAEKVGRGMRTNATDSGPCRFRAQLDVEPYVNGTKPTVTALGLRLRCQDTREMDPIDVAITFAGQRYRHTIMEESHFVIAEWL